MSLWSSPVFDRLTFLADWLPNHTLVLHVVVVFAVLNPLVIPFAFLYFCVESRT